MWVNSKALALAGIDASTPDPEGGQIIRDRSGEPSGVLVDNAMDLVFEAIGVASLEAVEADIVRGLEAAAATGLTSVHDAGVSAQEIQAYRNLQTAGRLPIRVYPMLSVLDPDNDPLLAEGPFRSEDGMLHVRSVKISADGALGSRGAALHRDYSDMPDHTGLLLLSDEELSQHIGRSAQAGFQVNVHAIGDLANTRVLEKFADINQSPKIRAQRHRVEHAQILRPQDINQFAKLDVIASIQPTHATSDKNMAEDRLGASRLEGAYAWNTLLRSQARLAGGSDFPVEPANPLYGLHAAVTRTDREGEPLGGWRPEEKLSRAEALSLFTEWAAYAGHEEEFLGRLAPGFAADFVLVKDDFFAQSEQAIWQNEVLATVVAGKVVYRSAASPM
jgi:predicted amidohydrolase YtcJ